MELSLSTAKLSQAFAAAAKALQKFAAQAELIAVQIDWETINHIDDLRASGLFVGCDGARCEASRKGYSVQRHCWPAIHN